MRKPWEFADHLPVLVDQLFDLADGVANQEEGRDGTRRVYSRPPDLHASIYLINRVMGKPTERREVAGARGEPAVDRGFLVRVLRSERATELVCDRTEPPTSDELTS